MDKCEIVVIGGGVVGAAAARALCLRGRQITVVERGVPGGEASGAAAGILGAVSETDADEVARLGLRSIALYRDLLAELGEAAAAVDFWKEGTIRLACSVAGEEALGERCARAARLAARAVAIEPRRLGRLEPLLAMSTARSAVLFPDEGRVDGGALSAALIGDVVRRGGALRAGCAVRRVVIEGGRVTGVETDAGAIACDAVVDAAGAWAGKFAGGPSLPVEPLRGQMVGLAAPRPVFRHTVYADAVYAVARRDGSLLLGSTRERAGYHKAATAAGVAGILGRAFALGPSVAQALRAMPVRAWWSGLRPLSRDGLPLVGFWPGLRGYMVAVGHGRNGVLLAPVTAELVADAFDGRRSAAGELLSPARLAVSGGAR
jgi:glycine oxidase